MKYITLSINGTPVPVPDSVSAANNASLERLIFITLEIIIIFAVLLALFFIIYSGIQWIISGGDKQKLQAARGRLTYSIVGLIIALIAIAAVNLIGSLLGISFFTP